MRITAGAFKGRSLKSPKGLTTRPTTSRVREALFNILGDRIEGAKILDLFAGSGLVTFEALSRGAESSMALDTSAASVAAFKENAVLLGVQAQAAILKSDVRKFLEKETQVQFDLIFADPPYDKGWGPYIAQKVFEKNLLKPGGILVIEEGAPLAESPFSKLDVRRYGRTTLNLMMAEG